MLKLTVRFAERPDGGLRAWSDDLPGFVLSHSDPQAVMADVEVALEAMLAAKYECEVKVWPLTPPERFDLTPELAIPTSKGTGRAGGRFMTVSAQLLSLANMQDNIWVATP